MEGEQISEKTEIETSTKSKNQIDLKIFLQREHPEVLNRIKQTIRDRFFQKFPERRLDLILKKNQQNISEWDEKIRNYIIQMNSYEQTQQKNFSTPIPDPNVLNINFIHRAYTTNNQFVDNHGNLVITPLNMEFFNELKTLDPNTFILEGILNFNRPDRPTQIQVRCTSGMTLLLTIPELYENFDPQTMDNVVKKSFISVYFDYIRIIKNSYDITMQQKIASSRRNLQTENQKVTNQKNIQKENTKHNIIQNEQKKQQKQLYEQQQSKQQQQQQQQH